MTWRNLGALTVSMVLPTMVIPWTRQNLICSSKNWAHLDEVSLFSSKNRTYIYFKISHISKLQLYFYAINMINKLNRSNKFIQTHNLFFHCKWNWCFLRIIYFQVYSVSYIYIYIYIPFWVQTTQINNSSNSYNQLHIFASHNEL